MLLAISYWLLALCYIYALFYCQNAVVAAYREISPDGWC